MRTVFFGSSDFSVYVLDELLVHKIKPELIVTTPDMPKGRKLILSPSPVKVWANKHGIETLSPEKLNNNHDLADKLSTGYDIFLVASYGKLIPQDIFNIPRLKTLNIHPSLLPKYRGASPITSQILNDERKIGVSVMQIEKEMDAGPIVIQKQYNPENWPMSAKELEKILATEGARLFIHVLPEWQAGAIQPIIQDERNATYCGKLEKKDGELKIDMKNLEKDAYQKLLKIKALEGWPGTYFFMNNKRIIITDAEIKDSKLKILRVIPEGKKEMDFESYLRGLKL